MIAAVPEAIDRSVAGCSVSQQAGRRPLVVCDLGQLRFIETDRRPAPDFLASEASERGLISDRRRHDNS